MDTPPDTPTSGFAIVNLKELEDSVSARVPGIEGRFGRSSLASEHLGISHFRYAPGFRATNGHHHGEQEEAYIVVGGSGRILLDGEVHDLRLWDVVRVGPAAVRAIEAGPDGIEFVAVGSDRPEGGDGHQVPVEWPE
jgi:mannose-6-phosphate isomerase-like protein (cupin superfamily)